VVGELAQLRAGLEEALLLVVAGADSSRVVQAGLQVECSLDRPKGGDLSPLLADTTQRKSI
jgi:hypothetical protein